MGLPLYVPVLYIGFLFGPLYVFSKYYMGKKQLRSNADLNFFEQNHARDVYISLLSHDPTPQDTLLISALITRSMEAIQRLMQIKNNKNSLGQLQNKGLIGDEFMAMFLEAEKELEAEIREVVEEANSYKQGWGQFILAHANDMVQHDKYKKTFEGIEKAKADYYAKHPHLTPPTESSLQPATPAAGQHLRSPQPSRTVSSASTTPSKTPSKKSEIVTPAQKLQEKVSSVDSTPAGSEDEKENLPTGGSGESSPNKSVKGKSKKGKKRK